MNVTGEIYAYYCETLPKIIKQYLIKQFVIRRYIH
jgi:hypothetical protein